MDGKRYLIAGEALAGGSAFALADASSSMFSGGMDGDTLIFQRWDSKDSDQMLYDIAGDDESRAPGVNTKYWEWGGSMSEDLILFARNNSSQRRDYWQKGFLYDMQAQEMDLVFRARAGSKMWTFPEQVNGNFATWYRCGRDSCTLFRHDVAADVTTKIPASGTWQYAPSIGPDGTEYYVRSGNQCGQNVKIARRPVGGPESVIESIPSGWDVGNTFAYTDGSSVTHLYFDLVDCDTGRADVYVIDGAESLRPVLVTAMPEGNPAGPSGPPKEMTLPVQVSAPGSRPGA